MSLAISQVEAELETALASLDGWVEDVLAHENDRFHELSSAWRAQAARIREMDRLLARTESADHERVSRVLRRRRAIAAARASTHAAPISSVSGQVRSRAYDDLMGTLAWVRELVSMIHLAKFTGAPASRAEELVAQIAAAIEGISAVTWQEAAPDSTARPKRQGSIPTRSQEEVVSCDLFQRIGDIIAANLNDLVDRFEDPEVMLKQAIREMETMIESATGGAARAIAGERLLARDLADHERKALRWNGRAEKAVLQGDDDLARQAIALRTRARSDGRGTARTAKVGGTDGAGPARAGECDASQAGRGPAEARKSLHPASAR